MRFIDYIATPLVIIGALNWGLIGFFSFDLVAFIFGEFSPLSRVVYILVGIAGIYEITRLKTWFNYEKLAHHY